MNLERSLKSVLITLAAFTLLSCTDWFQEKIPMEINTTPVDLGELFYREPAVSSLDAPSQVIVSKGLYPGKISITWNEVKNAANYVIERAVVKPDSAGNYSLPDEGDFENINKYVLKNTYEDVIITNPGASNSEYENHYFYRIYAQNISKKLISEASDFTKDDSRGEGWLFAAPKNVEADKGAAPGYITVRWTAVDGALSYVIYRGMYSTGTNMEVIGTAEYGQNFYRNEVLEIEQGTDFYYKVAAVNSGGVTSAQSSLALGYSLKDGAPVPPAVRVIDGKGTSKSALKIEWDTFNGEGTVKYNLYRKSSDDSVYSVVKKDLDGTSYTETSGLKTGIYYYYYVQTILKKDEIELKSAFSPTTDEATGFLLSPSSSLEIRDAEEGDPENTVRAVWTDAVGAEFVDYKYNIYVSSSVDGDYTLHMSEKGISAEDGSYRYCTVGKYAFYKISTVNENGTDKESILSSAAAPVPAAPVNVVASKTEMFDGYFFPNENRVYPVKITWEAPDEETSPYGYNVFRSQRPGSGFQKLTTAAPVKDFEYIDVYDNARAGTVYYYKVVSVNSLGQGTKGNNPETDERDSNGYVKSMGYGAITQDQWFREYNKTVKRSQKKLTLMHKTPDTKKLGSETIKGDLTGTLSYKAELVNGGLGGAEITMHYQDYSDYYMNNDASMGFYFYITGNTDTTSNMSANGNMHGIVVCKGMYPGEADYNTLLIKGGAAGGGGYGVTTYDQTGNVVFEKSLVDWLVGEE